VERQEVTLCPAWSWDRTAFTALIGMAKPSPTLPASLLELLLEDELYIEALIPMTSPELLSSGPPELPGLSEASVWIAL
jgi:hypothetical protein